MFFGKQKLNLAKVNSIIAAETVLTGNIEFSGTLKLCGKAHGVIFPAANKESVLIIEGSFTGSSITADHIIVIGSIDSLLVTAKKSLIVLAGAKLIANDINYGSLTINEMAEVNGMMKKIEEIKGP